jgi:hypothetical protein
VSSAGSATTYTGSTGLASPDQTITFSEVAVPVGQSIGSSYAAFGVTFQNLFQNDYGSFPNVSGNSAGNFVAQPVCLTECHPFEIDFTKPVTDAVFAMITNASTTPSTFQSFLGATPVETLIVFTGFTSATDFYGFTGSLFDRILVTPETAVDGAAVIDNLEFNVATPLPAALPLFASGVGLIGLLAARRRKQKRSFA